MKVRILTPTEVLLYEGVVHITVEDPTGSLGIRPGHAAMVTPLVPGVVTVRTHGGAEQYVAVNGGVMLVRAQSVEIAARQAVAGAEFGDLETTAVAGSDGSP